MAEASVVVIIQIWLARAKSSGAGRRALSSTSQELLIGEKWRGMSERSDEVQ